MKQHTSRFLTLVTEAKSRVKEITPELLQSKIDADVPLCIIDVRESHEWPSGHIPLAIHMSKGVIECNIEKVIPDTETQLVVYCSGGFRSALVADNLQRMGYTHVYTLNMGLQGWIDAGYAIVQ